MSEIKKEIISLRLDQEEKKILEKKAEQQCMKVSEYIRYCAFKEDSELDDNANKQNASEGDVWNKHFPLLFRAALKAALKSERIAQKLISQKEWDETEEEEYEICKRIGIELTEAE